MAGFEAGGFAEPAPEELYGWVAARQGDLARANGLDLPADTVVTTEVTARVADDPEQLHVESLLERLPSVGKAVVIIARMSRHADFVPANDRDALLGGSTAVIDSATLSLLEDIARTDESTPVDGQTGGSGGSKGRLVGRIARSMRERAAESQVEQQRKGDKERRARAIRDLQTLLRIHAGNRDKAFEVWLRSQHDNDALSVNAEFIAQYADDPDGLIAAISTGKDLDEEQRRRLQQDEVGMELGDIRREMANRRSMGLGLDAGDTERYRRYEAQRASRLFDDSGAVAAMDIRAEREAALVEAAVRNRPDGKVLIVTDENLATPGIAGPLFAIFGAAEIHTAGVPYHQLTMDHLEGVTGSYFPEQLTYNDVNQRYAIILLQGNHPPIKPTEFVQQIGEREGDMGIIPGNVDGKFITELLALLQDQYSEYHNKFRVETRVSGRATVQLPSLENPLLETGQSYDQPTYILVRDSSVESRTVAA